jgi:hypothetical protein
MAFIRQQPDLHAALRAAGADHLLAEVEDTTTSQLPSPAETAAFLDQLASQLEQAEVRDGWTTALLSCLDVARARLRRATTHTT